MYQREIMRGTIETIALFAALLSGCGKQLPQDSASKEPSRPEAAVQKVLVVHSYHPEYEWVAAINRGLQMAILPSDAWVETCYMDTKRRTDKGQMEQAGKEAMELIDEWQPDVVITVDDDAQRYVGSILAGREKPAVVFCGVNAEPEKYGYPASNVTGVLERLHFNESLAFLKSICPNAQRTVVLTDHSSTSFAVIDYIKSLPVGVMDVVDFVTPETFGQWQDAVLRYSEEVDAISVYVYHTVKRDAESEVSMPAREVMAWTAEHCPVPILGFLVFSVDDGSLCGVLESAVEQGQLAGEMAVAILHGTRPDELPIVTGTRGQKMLNMKMASKLGIEVSPEILNTIDVVVDH